MSEELGLITEKYLPLHLFGRYETHMSRPDVSLRGPIVSETDATSHIIYEVVCAAIDSCVRNLTFRTNPEVHYYWAIIDCDRPNACISMHGDFCCIAVSTSMINLYFNLVIGLCASPSFCRFVLGGEPTAAIPAAPVKSRVEAITHIIANYYETNPETLPTVALLTSQTFYFLASHELGHAMGGHLTSAYVAHAAVDEEAAVNADLHTSRCLERDADMFAVGSVCYRLVRIVEDENLDHPVLKTRTDAIRITFLSIYVFFCLCDSFRRDKQSSELSHPPAVIRMMNVLGSMSMYMRFMGTKDGFDECTHMMSHCVQALEAAIFAQGGGFMTNEEVNRFFEEGQVEIERHVQAWPSIKANLDRRDLDGLFWAAPIK